MYFIFLFLSLCLSSQLITADTPFEPKTKSLLEKLDGEIYVPDLFTESRNTIAPIGTYIPLTNLDDEGCPPSPIRKKDIQTRQKTYLPQATIKELLKKIKNKELTCKEASKKYKLPFFTVKNLVRNRTMKIENFLNTPSSFKKDIQLIDNPYRPVCIAWVIKKHKVTVKTVIKALSSLAQ